MNRHALLAAALAALTLPVLGPSTSHGASQEGQDEKKLSVKFKEASIDAVLQYISKETGWVFTQESGAKSSGTITAYSDTDVPLSKIIDFLNASLRQHNLVIVNPYSPGLPRKGDTLKVMDLKKAIDKSTELYVGSDPDTIPLTDQVRTQIVPLKAVNVVEVNKELGTILQNAMGDGAKEVAISTYSNSIILTGRCEGINRAVRILRVIDVSALAELKIRVFPLKNADATEIAKTLNDVFRKEALQGQTGRDAGGSRNWMSFLGGFGGGGGDKGGKDDRGGGTRALAHEMVRITAEQRTNSVIVSATDDNMKIIEELIRKLDDKTAAAMKLKLYALRYADATSVAKLVNDLFAETPTNSSSRDSGRGRGSSMLPVWMGGGNQGQGQEPLGATHEVRAVADLRTNSVLVAASEQRLLLIDAVMMEIDRQVNDMLVVKIYKLQNADAAQMATILQALFRPQVQATQNYGRGSGGQQQSQAGGSWWQQMQMAGGSGRGGGSQGGSSPLLPSQEVEITSDVRTRSVVVKASREYIAIIDDVVKQLDADPTETVSTYVVPLKNADAALVAQMLQNLTRTTGTGTGNSLSPSGYGQTGRTGYGQQQGPFSGMQLPNQGGYGSGMQGFSTRGTGSSGSSGFGSRGRGGFLGPLDPQEPAPPAGPQDEQELRRAIEGQVDVQPDPSTNSIVIRTSPRNFQSIQGVLQELDRLRPQVLIKVLIADVTLDENTQFGVQGFWEGKWRINSDLATNKGSTTLPLGNQGFTYLLDGGNEFQATLNMFASQGKLRVLATPRILALDNQTANIQVGKEVPIVTNTTINPLGNAQNSVERQNIGILLQVTPHVNPDGLVTLFVAPEVSDLASAAESVQIAPGANSPTFNVNRAQTTVAVRNGTTVVIGGLIRETSDDAVQKVPILGDLPILGALFSSTTKTRVKRELMIFLTPYVAYTASQLEEVTELEKSRLKLLDPRDIESESDRWLDRVRR